MSSFSPAVSAGSQQAATNVTGRDPAAAGDIVEYNLTSNNTGLDPAAARVAVVLGRILGEAARAGLLPPAEGRTTRLVTPAAAEVLGGDHPALDDAVHARALLTWSSLFGLIGFELFGHFVGSVEDGDRYFDRAMTELPPGPPAELFDRFLRWTDGQLVQA